MIPALLMAAFSLAPIPAPAERLTVADVVKALGLDEAEFRYDDEPPGKLQAVRCPATLNNVRVSVRIEVRYVLPDLSQKKGWDIKNVRRATAHKVTIEFAPLGSPKSEPEYPPSAPKTEAKLPPPSKQK